MIQDRGLSAGVSKFLVRPTPKLETSDQSLRIGAADRGSPESCFGTPAAASISAGLEVNARRVSCPYLDLHSTQSN